MGKLPPAQYDWKRPKCNDAHKWTWAKNSNCHICFRPKPNNVLCFGHTATGKEVAKKNQVGAAGRSGGSPWEMERLKAELAKSKAANEKLQQTAQSGAADPKTLDINVGVSVSSTTAELEAEIETLIESSKVLAKQLKKRPCDILQSAATEVKEKLETKRQQLRDSKDAHEQLRAKTNRVSKLTAANKELFAKSLLKLRKKRRPREQSTKYERKLKQPGNKSNSCKLKRSRWQENPPRNLPLQCAQWWRILKRASRPRWTTLELPVQLGWPLRKSKPKRLLHRLQAYCRRWLPSTRPLRKVLTMQQKRQQCQKVTKLRFFNNSWSYRESHLQALTRQQGEFQLMQVYYQWFRLQVLLRLRHQVWRRASSCLSRHVSDQKKSSLHLSARLPAKARLPTWSNKHGAFLTPFMSVSGASIMGQYFLFSWAEFQLGPNFYDIFRRASLLVTGIQTYEYLISSWACVTFGAF